MTRQFPDLPDWQFDVAEVSAGVYEVVARDRLGRRVSKTGTDPDEILEECRRWAYAQISPDDLSAFFSQTLEEHLSLGEHKCVSYLPIPTIIRFLGMTPESYAAEATRRGLATMTIEEERCCIKGDAVYAYSLPHLKTLLERSRNVLQESNWPSDSDHFIRAIAREWLEDGHPVKSVIRAAFGDEDVGP